MTLKEKLQNDVKTFMKEKSQEAVLTLRGVLSEVKKGEIDSQKEFDEATVVAVIQKEIKKRRDTLEFAKKANREDMIGQNEREILLLQQYLPKQLSESELKAVVQEIIAKGAENMGQVMGALNGQYKGQFDGRAASELVKSLLG